MFTNENEKKSKESVGLKKKEAKEYRGICKWEIRKIFWRQRNEN